MRRSGTGEPIEVAIDEKDMLSDLRRKRLSSNATVLANLREDEHAKELRKACFEDLGAGRMSPLHELEEVDSSAVNISPRFGVERDAR